MNPHLERLNAYPFARLRALLQGTAVNTDLSPIDLTIGEPRHPVPAFVPAVLAADYGKLGKYPAVGGTAAFKAACLTWLKKRYDVELQPEEVISCNGSKEALFAFIQAVLDPNAPAGAGVVIPNPAYQIYEGATIVAGGKIIYADTCAPRFFPDWNSINPEAWRQTQIVVVCSPHNPTGAVSSQLDWEILFKLQKQYGFIIAADECYGEIYYGEKPIGLLEAARKSGLDYRGKVMFTSLSKRSNLPGLRSGFIAGDAAILAMLLKYRSYQGAAMSELTQAVAVAAWQDEKHVEENRRLYRQKFAAVVPVLRQKFTVAVPAGAFYLWLAVGDDVLFTRKLYQQQNVKVLPGSFLEGAAAPDKAGRGYVRMALVDSVAVCTEAAKRIINLLS